MGLEHISEAEYLDQSIEDLIERISALTLRLQRLKKKRDALRTDSRAAKLQRMTVERGCTEAEAKIAADKLGRMK
jgi:hypothetical protein